MSNEQDTQIIEFPEIPYEECLQLAQEKWKQSNRTLSV